MLKQTFYKLVHVYTPDQQKADELWTELVKNYTGKKRYYHNLVHLENLLTELKAVKSEIADWHTLLFTLFYHDAVYTISKNDNEEKSAQLAATRMRELGVDVVTIAKCEAQILATKKHHISPDKDTNLFTDADLSILGKDPEIYRNYFQNVRKEYSIYPDLIYKPGRKKVLQHFLNMPRIFKTDFFFIRYEKQAKLNLQTELESL